MLNLGESKIYSPYNVYLDIIRNDRFKYSQLHDKLKGLPESFQDFIFDTRPGDFIKDKVAIPLGLGENQTKEIAKIVLELILADIYLGNIVDDIENRVGIDKQKAGTIAGLIVVELFAPILEDLKKIHTEKFAGATKEQEVEKEPSPQPPTPTQPPAEDESIIDLRNVL